MHDLTTEELEEFNEDTWGMLKLSFSCSRMSFHANYMNLSRLEWVRPLMVWDQALCERRRTPVPAADGQRDMRAPSARHKAGQNGR